MNRAVADVGPDVWLAAGYCLLLVGLAYLIDGLARRAATTSEGGASFGFSYHADHDAWRCPQDQWLWPDSFDPDQRVMRYRGTPSVCNACPVKRTCTPSLSGREIQRAVDPWPASEAARFHRGIACAVVLMGQVWPLATLATGPHPVETAVLCGSMAASLVASLPLWSHFRRSTVVLPDGMVHRSLEETVAERRLSAARVRRHRTTYGSDRRESERGGPAW